jgi:hypothetical protein
MRLYKYISRKRAKLSLAEQKKRLSTRAVRNKESIGTGSSTSITISKKYCSAK